MGFPKEARYERLTLADAEPTGPVANESSAWHAWNSALVRAAVEFGAYEGGARGQEGERQARTAANCCRSRWCSAFSANVRAATQCAQSPTASTGTTCRRRRVARSGMRRR